MREQAIKWDDQEEEMDVDQSGIYIMHKWLKIAIDEKENHKNDHLS